MADEKYEKLTPKGIKQVSRLRVGDRFLGHCWLCKSACITEVLANGHWRDIGIFTDIEEVKQRAGQIGLFDSEAEE